MDGGSEGTYGGPFGGGVDRMASVAEKSTAQLLPPMTDTLVSVKATSDRASAMLDAVRAGRVLISVRILGYEAIRITVNPF